MIFCGSDSLVAFPPRSVQLKRPFAIQPWINSEANIGNLLMVRSSFFLLYELLEVPYMLISTILVRFMGTVFLVHRA